MDLPETYEKNSDDEAAKCEEMECVLNHMGTCESGDGCRAALAATYERGRKAGRAEAFKECVEIVKSTYIDSNDPPLTCWQDKCVRNIEAAAKDKED